MKTVLLCTLFLIVGAVTGGATAGYFVDRSHKRIYATLVDANLVGDAMNAELLKSGDAAIVLSTLEKGIPGQVLAIKQNDLLRGSELADTSMMAAKRFYVCTHTPVPTEISEILEPVALRENPCENPQ